MYFARARWVNERLAKLPICGRDRDFEMSISRPSAVYRRVAAAVVVGDGSDYRHFRRRSYVACSLAIIMRDTWREITNGTAVIVVSSGAQTRVRLYRTEVCPPLPVYRCTANINPWRISNWTVDSLTRSLLRFIRETVSRRPLFLSM